MKEVGLESQAGVARAGLLLAVIGVPLLLVFHSRSRRLYIALALTIISSMVISPLPELDGVEQTLTVYGLDEAGNRTNSPWCPW